ncbi:cytochrome P450 4V3 [Podospora didyma]|uniref:Cytochrome P450 4V3 n=1 Tax=Podospora didyma TaxID=330526 RepID=A0AAE0NPY4_9PEZI|nr:cytochrome P450 4V3 [Podospora didyma]
MEAFGVPALRLSVLQGLGAMLALGAVYVIYRLFKVRLTFRALKAQGIPMMPHSFLLGHLPIVFRLVKSVAPDIHLACLPQLIMENWQSLFPYLNACPGAIYLDIWPLGQPVLFTLDPTLAAQCLSDQSLTHSKMSHRYIRPLTDNLDLFSVYGATWRTWRSRLSPGFSSRAITALVPALIEEVSIFRDILRSKTTKGGDWGEAFLLEPLTTKLTFDVIGRAGLDIRLRDQTNGPSPLYSALLDQMNHCLIQYNILTLPTVLSPIRQWKMWRNSRTMREYLLPSIQARLGDPGTFKPKYRTIVDLAVEAARKETTTDALEDIKSGPLQPSKEFLDSLIAQLKIFIFAGHDTTATSIAWALHNAAKHPATAEKLRAEHTAVFGPDLSTVIPQLTANPHLLNALPYTLAFVKETLRFAPPGGLSREGSASFQLAVPGCSVPYPTEGFMIYDGIIGGMRWGAVFPRPNEFLPERFLVGPEDPLHPPKNAWRPFGVGPRFCIGQELAITEIKMALVLVVRELDVDCAWDKWDAQRNYKGSKHTVDGHRCYLTGQGTTHPTGGMPVHVRFRDLQA